MTASPIDARRVELLFDAVADLEPSKAKALLDDACRESPELRDAVERLLAHDKNAPAEFLAPDPARAARALETFGGALGRTVLEGTAGGANDHGLRESARVGRYLVLRKLGDGGMGDVYAAYDESLGRRVALKVLRTGTDGVPVDWLRREAHALARLSHPNVVQVHEVGEDGGHPFVAMELVDGLTLREWLEREPRSANDILRMFVQCGRGLVAAHDAGLVHRDFKPINVIVGNDGRARVLDFGIAALGMPKDPLAGGSEGHGHGGDDDFVVGGTPLFMSPEQFAAERITTASDQFSFSVALYRALYGAAPFAGEDLPTLRRNVLSGALRKPPPAAVPDWVLPILLRGLARHAAARHDSMAEMLTAIEARLPRDPDLDPSVTRRERRVLAALMFGSGGALVIGLELRGGMSSLTTPRQLVVVACLVFAASLGSVIALRRRLLANRFGARAAGVLLVSTATLVVHRLVAMRFDETVPHILAVDMLALAFELGMAAFLLQRWFAWGALFLFAGALTATFAPAWSLPAMAASSMTSFAAGYLAWARE